MESRMTSATVEKVPIEVLAYHEAGHTVASHRLYRPDHPLHMFKPVSEVSIVPDERGAATVTALRRDPSAVKARLAEYPGMRDDLRGLVEDEVMYSLAGYAAEDRWEKRTKEEAWKFVEGHSYLVFHKKHHDRGGKFPGRDWAPDITEAWEYLSIFEPDGFYRQYWLKLLFERTWKSLGDWWTDIERVAQALLKRRTLDSDELNELLGRSNT